MKKLKNIVLLSFLSLAFLSCEDEDSVQIDSLQVFGEEFYYGETVNVGMAVHSSDPDNTSYYWECDGGSFLQRQGYTINQWKAPKRAGVYKIKCTVTCGSAKQTREADIMVSGLFFERFSGANANSLPTGWSQTNTTGGFYIRDKRLELVVAQGFDHGEVRYNIGQSNFFPPFSCKSDVGIVGAPGNINVPLYPNSDNSSTSAFASKFPSADNYCGVAITANTPSATLAPTYFINELRVEFYPEADHAQSEIKYLRVGGEPGNPADSVPINKADFDGILRFQWTRRANVAAGIVQLQSWYSIPFKAAVLRYGAEQPVTIGLSVDEDYIVSVAANGNEIFSTEELKNWRQTIIDLDGVGAPIAAKEFKYLYPANTRVFLDNVFFYAAAYYDEN
ncbi:MAG: hypothetical protein LBR34_11290 [Prevotella sp.]|jgi:hypothetical protein|nr:hypothetical protein [Prevotella sp.]